MNDTPYENVAAWETISAVHLRSEQIALILAKKVSVEHLKCRQTARRLWHFCQAPQITVPRALVHMATYAGLARTVYAHRI